MSSLLNGEKVRLTAAGLKPTDVDDHARWFGDDLYLRLLDTDPAEPLLAQVFRDEVVKGEIPEHAFEFAIRTLADDRHIGFIGLRLMPRPNRDAWIGMGLGERADWGQGYGADALRVATRFAFLELGLHRLSLGVFAYNPRARRAYEKAGFVVEGCTRGDTLRDGQRSDSYWMGLLRSDWEK